ncbi:hypothetical protein C8J56DRAFT_960319 [Mycena floridula]|nr:hypothetical protein C8J56DRAFT_960319 [Mycena floridula]
MGEPLAIFRLAQDSRKDQTLNKGEASCSDIYALDYSTSRMLRAIPDTVVGNPLQIFTYGNYTFFRLRSHFQGLAIIMSATKVVETYILWKKGAFLLGITSSTPWAYFFLGAVLIQIQDILLGRHPEPEMGGLDIISGQLPLVSREGGPRKIVLGASVNPRTSVIWRVFWATGAMVSTASTVLTYFTMGQQHGSVVFIWAGFQLLWLGARILVYYLADPATDPMASRLLVIRPWSVLPSKLKERVIELTLALAKYQSRVHPRGPEHYTDDTFISSNLCLISDGINIYPLPDLYLPSVSIEIRAIFGDTSLSSAVWITGAYMTPMDLYDSCIVVFSIRQSNHPASPCRSVAVPAARVLTGFSAMDFAQRSDAERNMPVFVPKGAPISRYRHVWWYWIPCRTGVWLQLQVPGQAKAVGIHEADIRTDAQVTDLLGSGMLGVSLKDVDEVKAIVELSRKARESFLELLG